MFQFEVFVSNFNISNSIKSRRFAWVCNYLSKSVVAKLIHETIQHGLRCSRIYLYLLVEKNNLPPQFRGTHLEEKNVSMKQTNIIIIIIITCTNSNHPQEFVDIIRRVTK